METCGTLAMPRRPIRSVDRLSCHRAKEVLQLAHRVRLQFVKNGPTDLVRDEDPGLGEYSEVGTCEVARDARRLGEITRSDTLPTSLGREDDHTQSGRLGHGQQNLQGASLLHGTAVADHIGGNNPAFDYY